MQVHQGVLFEIVKLQPSLLELRIGRCRAILANTKSPDLARTGQTKTSKLMSAFGDFIVEKRSRISNLNVGSGSIADMKAGC